MYHTGSRGRGQEKLKSKITLVSYRAYKSRDKVEDTSVAETTTEARIGENLWSDGWKGSFRRAEMPSDMGIIRVSFCWLIRSN